MNIENLRVGDLMHPVVKTVTESMPLEEAARLMYELHVSSLVIEKENENDAFGILTRKDLVEALCAGLSGDDALLVQDVMTKPAITVAPELSLSHCLKLMRMAGVRRVPVVQGGALAGILSNTDVFRWCVENSASAQTPRE